eukprot:superscaffoldBa00000597_g5938
MTQNRSIMMKRTPTLYLLFISGFCHLTVGSSDFHLITLLKNYQEAKSHCREMYTDLATVHDATDMNNLITLVSNTTPRAWIGLENDNVWMWHWSWPDQKVDFFKWRAGEPKEKNEDACAAMDERGEWFESSCGTKRRFLCHGNSDTGGHMFVSDTKSWRDAQNHCRGLSSDLVSIHSEEENEAVRNVSVSRDVWIGLFRDPWKWSDGSNSSFRYWKPIQPNYLEGQDCVAAIFKDNGRWNDLRCTGKRNFVCHGGNLILIQENMTWTEAMSYCREHHFDLVYITSRDIQKKVAEKARNATSAHVWLGLRYTCNFDFWFWTSSATGCYQNWAPGQGSEVKYDCGVTGAIEATGRQQWVGLPETEKLNFICHACAG